MEIEQIDWQLCCPVCRGPVNGAAAGRCHCTACGLVFVLQDGIWNFLPLEREPLYAQFLREYALIRAAEERTRTDPGYYRALPYPPQDDPLAAMWRQRARSWLLLQQRVLTPLEPRRLRIVDMGAGNGWLSHQLARRGHRPAAVDIFTDDGDGLGAAHHYQLPLPLLRAEFTRVPLAAAQADLVIFNASFHYAENYVDCLREAARLLHPGGMVVVMDTPVYQARESGMQMVREREAAFTERYGFPSNALPARHFLTQAGIALLAEQLGIRWRLQWAVPRWRRRLRRWRRGLYGRRQAAEFPLLVGRF